jgi:hypothetical protein
MIGCLEFSLGWDQVSLHKALAVMLFLLVGLEPSLATVRIGNNRGGQIGEFLAWYTRVRDAGEQVIIDGQCFSACALVVSVIPPERLCVTSRAALGFHVAWQFDGGGRPTVNQLATRMLMELYPVAIRKWLSERGGLTTRTLWLRGPELAAFYRTCQGP